MTVAHAIYNRFKRYRTLRTDHISVLPVVILMPHSACNCRCVMCDIWKDNKNLKQLDEKDIRGLLMSLKKLETQKLVMSGGEALLNPNFFRLCDLVKKQGIRISLLTTGLLLRKYAKQLSVAVDDIIVSLDGNEIIHDKIRNTPAAFKKLSEGVHYLKTIDPAFPVSARTVIQQSNFREWISIIEAAKQMGLDKISFLPADVSSHAFNREVLWSDQRKEEIMPAEKDLPLLKEIIEYIIAHHGEDFHSGFIVEKPDKLRKIYSYYAAFYGLNPFPFKKCNAPWVSAVIEPDGNLRPCFFLPVMGNTREKSLDVILNSEENIRFRKKLDTQTNPTCEKCVCYLNLSPGTKL